MRESLPVWDPTRVFPGPESKEVDAALSAVRETSARLAREVRGSLAGLGTDALVRVIRRYEECVAGVQRVTSYAEALYALHDQGPAVRALLERCDTAWAGLAEELGFFEAELAACDGAHGPGLGPYAHFAAKVRRSRAGRTASPERQEVLAALAPTGIEGWQRLARDLLGRITVEIDGERRDIATVLPILYDADVAARTTAHEAVCRALAPELELRATALRMIVADGRARAGAGAPDWLAARRDIDQIDEREAGRALAQAAACVPVVHDYYAFKRELAPQEEFTDRDRYAPLAGTGSGGTYSWPEAVEVVAAAFGDLSPVLAERARHLFGSGAVDARPRPGKQRRAATHALPGSDPCVALHFQGRLRDVLTLAHEMGHAVHLSLAARLPLLAAAPPPVLGECVALLCEAVAVRRLMADGPAARRAGLLARWLEDRMVAVGRHAALHSFEAALRAPGIRAGELTADRIGELWTAGQRRLYGPAVELTGGYAMWWSYLGDLFAQPGSHLAYVHGQVSALALLERFEADPAAFGERFVDLLSAGDTAPPAELLARAGVHADGPAGAGAAAAVLRERLDLLRKLTAEAAPAR
ncbi:M3 family metallopeptidase, partial [Streptomyces fuscigenes]|uniref:M3 family metallopeptidase n=1 Tax=Streptomyces fuscigenes TaxID=1528880 RepID=UPI001F21108F